MHVLSASPAEIEMRAKAGSPVSVSPGTEMRIGFGFPKVGEFLAAGVRVGISVDNTVLAGDAHTESIRFQLPPEYDERLRHGVVDDLDDAAQVRNEAGFDVAGAVRDIVVSATCACFRVRTSSGETNRS